MENTEDQTLNLKQYQLLGFSFFKPLIAADKCGSPSTLNRCIGLLERRKKEQRSVLLSQIQQVRLSRFILQHGEKQNTRFPFVSVTLNCSSDQKPPCSPCSLRHLNSTPVAVDLKDTRAWLLFCSAEQERSYWCNATDTACVCVCVWGIGSNLICKVEWTGCVCAWIINHGGDQS